MLPEFDAWMLRNDMSEYKFVRRFGGISQPFLNQVRNGRKRLSANMAYYISQCTNGEVPFDALYRDPIEFAEDK